MTILSILFIVIAVVLFTALIFWLAGIVLAVGVFILIMIAVIKLLIVPYFENRQKARLDANHILLTSEKTVVRVDTNQFLNGFNPYVIDCYYTSPESGREYVFTSEPFMVDPSTYISGRALGIFVDPLDYSNYYVDTSFISK